jgi:hypothetical protein
MAHHDHWPSSPLISDKFFELPMLEQRTREAFKEELVSACQLAAQNDAKIVRWDYVLSNIPPLDDGFMHPPSQPPPPVTDRIQTSPL